MIAVVWYKNQFPSQTAEGIDRINLLFSILSFSNRAFLSKEDLDSSKTWGFSDISPTIYAGEISENDCQSR